MGVDADIFAVKADKACDIDRLDNLQSAIWYYTEESDLIEKLKDEASYGGKISSTKMLELAKLCRKVYEDVLTGKVESEYTKDTGEDKDRLLGKIYWMDCLIMFVNRYPDDEFMIVSDHEDRWHDMWELHKREDLIDWPTWKKDNAP